jgi:hypothetical protein
MMHPTDALIQAALRWTADQMDEPSAHYDAQLEYDEDMLLEAAIYYVANNTRSGEIRR